MLVCGQHRGAHVCLCVLNIEVHMCACVCAQHRGAHVCLCVLNIEVHMCACVCST